MGQAEDRAEPIQLDLNPDRIGLLVDEMRKAEILSGTDRKIQLAPKKRAVRRR